MQPQLINLHACRVPSHWILPALHACKVRTAVVPCARRPSWSLALVVLVISLGLGLLVAGETEFNLAGFVIVMVASALSGLRWTITQVLLQGSEAHGTGARAAGAAASPPSCHARDSLHRAQTPTLITRRFTLYAPIRLSSLDAATHDKEPEELLSSGSLSPAQVLSAPPCCCCAGSSGGPVEVLLALMPGAHAHLIHVMRNTCSHSLLKRGAPFCMCNKSCLRMHAPECGHMLACGGSSRRLLLPQ